MKNPVIAIALSGGVDSLVSGYLLKLSHLSLSLASISDISVSQLFITTLK